MGLDEAAPHVIDIAKSFVALVRDVEPKWQKGYLRFCSHDLTTEVKASYVHGGGVEIINTLKHKNFFGSFTKKGKELLAALGKDRGLFLLVIDSSLNYEIKFEYQNLERWRITKLEGASGIPEGLE